MAACVKPLYSYARHQRVPHRPEQFRSAARRARDLADAHGIRLEAVASSDNRFGEAVFVYPPASIDNPLDDPWFDCHCADGWVDAANRVEAYAAILRDDYL